LKDANLEIRYSSDRTFATFSTANIYSHILDVDYDFDAVLKDRCQDGKALNYSKARYVVEMSVPVFDDTFNVGLYNTMMSFLLAPYKRIFPVSGKFNSPLVASFTSSNEINLVSEDKDKEKFNNMSSKRILNFKLFGETNTYNI
jgi:hypothetical protein